jgi:uncharacterized protein DUF551
MEWISINIVLPNTSEIVLVCDQVSDFVSLGRYLPDLDEFQLMALDKVTSDMAITHWMPLPQPPLNEVEDKGTASKVP